MRQPRETGAVGSEPESLEANWSLSKTQPILEVAKNDNLEAFGFCAPDALLRRVEFVST